MVHLYLSSFDVETEQVDGGVAHREEDAGEREALEPDGGDDGGDSGDDAVADGDENDALLMVSMPKMSLMMMEMVVLMLVMLMVMVVMVMVLVMVRGKYRNL